jgi:hypothetical protein
MKTFEPSGEFVTRVMESVYAHEESKRRAAQTIERLYHSRPLRIALAGSGLLAGLWTLARLYHMLFMPPACG